MLKKILLNFIDMLVTRAFSHSIHDRRFEGTHDIQESSTGFSV